MEATQEETKELKEDLSNNDTRIKELSEEAKKYRQETKRLNEELSKLKRDNELSGLADKEKLEALTKEIANNQKLVDDLRGKEEKLNQIIEKREAALEDIIKDFSTEDRELIKNAGGDVEDLIKLAKRLKSNETSSIKPGKPVGNASDAELLKKYNDAVRSGDFEKVSESIKELEAKGIKY